MDKLDLSSELFPKINIQNIVIILIVFLVMFFLTKIIKQFIHKLSEKYTEKRILLKNFVPIINIVINLIGLSVIFFGVLEISKDFLITFGVSAGVAIGFAIQDFLANIFGGLVIIFTRPFNIGDKIEVGSYYGEVIDINLLKIKIVTADDSEIYIPAKSFLASSVSNANAGQLHCQVTTDLLLPGDIDLQMIKETGFEAVYSCPLTCLDKPISITFSDEFKERPLIRMRIKAYVYDHRYEKKFSSEIYERIKTHLRLNNIISAEFYRV